MADPGRRSAERFLFGHILELGSAAFKIDAKRDITPSIAPRDLMNAAILEWTIGRMQIAARRLMALLVSLESVEVEGEHYWDGGYMGNPALFPLIYSCESRDILIVHVNPIERPDKPTSAREIMNRVDEISFNSSLMREMRAVAFITKLMDDGKLSDAKRLLIHSVCADDIMRGLGAASKLNTDGGFLRELRALGSERARAWIDRHFDDLGSRSTIDIQAAYL